MDGLILLILFFSGVTNGLKTNGCPGWYEQPEELFGIRNRLLPIVLESGQTADLPIIDIGVITNVDQLKIWITDFNDERHYFEQRDIDKVKQTINRYLESTNG